MKNIAIYGAGGLGRETALLIKQVNALQSRWNLLGFYDDTVPMGTKLDQLTVLGDLKDLNNSSEPLDVIVSISDPEVRRAIVMKISNPLVTFPVLVHPTCQTGDETTNQFGKGCILTAGVILTTSVSLGEFVIVNLSSTIGHDAKVGEFSSIMPGCNISGNVNIGPMTYVGTGAQILQNLSIGKNCRIGAGAVLTRDFGDSKMIVGIPADEK